MRSPGRNLLLAVAVVVVAVAVAACGSSGSGSSGSTKKTTYQNAAYGFNMTYGDPLSLVPLTASGGEKYAVAFADKDGALVNDEYVNGIRVSVNDLGVTIKPSMVPKLQKVLQTSVETATANEPGGKLTSKVTPTKVNGVPGYYVDYVFTQGGKEVTSRMYFVMKGHYQYVLAEQALTSDWTKLQPTLEETVQTFTLD